MFHLQSFIFVCFCWLYGVFIAFFSGPEKNMRYSSVLLSINIIMFFFNFVEIRNWSR